MIVRKRDTVKDAFLSYCMMRLKIDFLPLMKKDIRRIVKSKKFWDEVSDTGGTKDLSEALIRIAMDNARPELTNTEQKQHWKKFIRL